MISCMHTRSARLSSIGARTSNIMKSLHQWMIEPVIDANKCTGSGLRLQKQKKA